VSAFFFLYAALTPGPSTAPTHMLVSSVSGKPVVCREAMQTDRGCHHIFWVPLVRHLVRDQRDLPIALLIFNAAICLVPFACLVYYSNSHWVGLAYVVFLYVVFFGRYMSMLHEFVHNRVFTSWWFGFVFVTLLLSAMHGVPAGTYHLNHLIMHHKGGNAWGVDYSSTERFQRDSFVQFIGYWLRHYTPPGVMVDLVRCCARWRKGWLGLVYGASMTGWLALVWYMWASVHRVGTLWVWMVPMMLSGMAGAWAGLSTHVFLNPEQPRRWYSYDIINSRANTHHFNQGFHATHHLDCAYHWTELPRGFVRSMAAYRDNGVLIFQEIDNPMLLLWLFLGRYDVVASHMVGFRRMGQAEAIRLLKAHLRPVVVG